MRRLALRIAYAVYSLRWRIFHPITLGVRMVLMMDTRVVLIRHSYQSNWFLPGGGVKRGESLAEAAVREVREEVGAVIVGEPRLVGVYVNYADGRNDHVALFASDQFYLVAPTDAWEVEERALVDVLALPADLPADLGAHIADALAGLRGAVAPW